MRWLENTKNSCTICNKQDMYKRNLVTTKLLPLCTYTFAPVVLTLLETPLEILFWYGSDTCFHILLNFFYWHKTSSEATQVLGIARSLQSMGAERCLGKGTVKKQISCTQMSHWQMLLHNILHWFKQDVNNVGYLFHQHTPIRHHDSTNYCHILVTPWGCWPATLLIFWRFLATFKVVVPVRNAANFFDIFSIKHTKA